MTIITVAINYIFMYLMFLLKREYILQKAALINTIMKGSIPKNAKRVKNTSVSNYSFMNQSTENI